MVAFTTLESNVGVLEGVGVTVRELESEQCHSENDGVGLGVTEELGDELAVPDGVALADADAEGVADEDGECEGVPDELGVWLAVS